METGNLPQDGRPFLRVVVWGTYDVGKPRVRILLRGLRQNKVQVIECHKEVWMGVEDKSQVKGIWAKLKFLLRWIGSYPQLISRYLRLPRHDAVLLSYLGHLDVLVLWPFAKLRRVPLVWDAFLSLYDTVVDDRKLVDHRNPLAWLLYAWEWGACRAADVVILDTVSHGKYFVDTFHVAPKKVKRVFAGAEPDVFIPKESRPHDLDSPLTVLFYGQFIPLHGIDTVVQAAGLSGNRNIDWMIIGRGQEADNIRKLVKQVSPTRLRWIDWVPYTELVDWIHRADVCLGIFGTSAKAARVIPNKVFQILAAGKPLITRDSPAIRELVDDHAPGIVLVPPGDANAVVEAVTQFSKGDRESLHNQTLHAALALRTSPEALGGELRSILEDVTPVQAGGNIRPTDD